MESRAPEPCRGRGGKGGRKTPAWWRGSGEGAAPSAGGCILRPGSRSRACPRRRKGEGPSLWRQPPASSRRLPARVEPRVRIHVCSPRGARELSPHARGALDPRTSQRRSPSRLVSLSRVQKDGCRAGAPWPPSRWPRNLPKPRVKGSGRRAAPSPGGSARDRPGPGLWRRAPRWELGSGLGSGEFSQGSRQLPASEAPGGGPLPHPGRGRLIHLSMGRAHRRVLVTEFTVNAQKHQKGSVWLGEG